MWSDMRLTASRSLSMSKCGATTKRSTPSNFWPSASALAVRLEQGVERDDRLAVGRALADDAGPHGVVKFRVAVGHDRPLAERVPGGLVAHLDRDVADVADAGAEDGGELRLAAAGVEGGVHDAGGDEDRCRRGRAGASRGRATARPRRRRRRSPPPGRGACGSRGPCPGSSVTSMTVSCARAGRRRVAEPAELAPVEDLGGDVGADDELAGHGISSGSGRSP